MKSIYFSMAAISIGTISGMILGSNLKSIVVTLFAYTLWVSTVGLIVDEVRVK